MEKILLINKINLNQNILYLNLISKENHIFFI